MDITIDDVLMILDEHYNNVKVLDVLNQGLFQLQKLIRRLYQTGVSASVDTYKYWQYPSQTTFPLDHVAELKRDHFYGGLPK